MNSTIDQLITEVITTAMAFAVGQERKDPKDKQYRLAGFLGEAKTNLQRAILQRHAVESLVIESETENGC